MSRRRTATPGPTGNGAQPPVELPPPAPDPRGVRVTVLAVDDLEGVGPAVFEPAPVPLAMAEPSVGVGLLGGVAPVPADAPAHAVDVPLTLDGSPVHADLRRLDEVRALLRDGRDGRDGRDPRDTPPSRLLLLDADPSGARDGALRREVVVDGWRFEVELEAAARAALRDRARRGRDEAGRSGPTEVRAIIPGVVVSVSVTAGDEVAAGQQLLVVEAMKMQNELRAPRDGTIERVATSPGATIEVGDLLLVIA